MKYGMFAFISALISFSAKMNFADEMGGGAGGDDAAGNDNSDAGGGNDGADNGSNDNSDIGDQEIDDESSDGDASLSADEIKQAREIIAEKSQTEILKKVETSIQARVSDFKMDAVVAGLKKLHETDPSRAAFYNASEAGLEMFHRDHLANIAQSDDVNDGSHSGSSADFDSTLEKARGGDKKSVKSALAQSKA